MSERVTYVRRIKAAKFRANNPHPAIMLLQGEIDGIERVLKVMGSRNPTLAEENRAKVARLKVQEQKQMDEWILNGRII